MILLAELHLIAKNINQMNSSEGWGQNIHQVKGEIVRLKFWDAVRMNWVILQLKFWEYEWIGLLQSERSSIWFTLADWISKGVC